MSAPDLSSRLAALTPAQRALFEAALREQEKAATVPPDGPPGDGTGAARDGYRPPQITPRPRPDGIAPLSVDQERLWFLQQFDLDSPVYNIYGADRFRGPLDVDALTRALNELVRRHEILRTSFPAIDGRPVQRIAPFFQAVIPVADLSGLPAEIREDAAAHLAAEFVTPAFRLNRLPLFRALLIRVGPQDHVCPIALHHLVVDWISYYAMMAELTATYEAFRRGLPSPFVKNAVQFADFAIWQQERLADPAVVEEQLAYWRRQLDGAPELLPLPTDRPRPAIATPWGARRRIVFTRAQSEGFMALAQREGVTQFIAMLALLKALLVRWTGEEKLIVGTPMAYRQGPEMQGILGFFLNQLALYSDLTGDPPFREALRRVRDVSLAAYAHQDLPFARLVQELRPQRDLSRYPFTQVTLLLLHPEQLDRPEAGELQAEAFWVDAQRTQFDINLAIWEREGLFLGFFEYNTDLFDATTIDRMKEGMRTVLGGILADPDRRLWDLAVLSEAQTHQLAREWPESAEARVVDRNGRPVPIGVPGALWREDRDTGDTARFGANGRLELLEWHGGQWIVRGSRVEPEPVPVEASPEVVEEVAAVLEGVLGRPLGRDENFFNLGGHSLSAFQAVARLRDAFAIELAVSTVFAFPTPASLAGEISRLMGRGPQEDDKDDKDSKDDGSWISLALPPVTPAGREGDLPASFSQQRLWFLDRLRPGTTAYNLGAGIRLGGDLSPAALAAAVGEIVRRHEALRTTFASGRDGQAVQRIGPAAPVPVPVVDLSGLPEERIEAEGRRWAGEELGRSFDLETGPLLRLTLLRLGERDHALLFSIHHIVSDAWSLGIFTRELIALYTAAVSGAPEALPELPVQYADYAVWQRRWLQGEPLEAEVRWWRDRLAGAPPALELPTDRPRPALQSFAGANLPVAVPLGPDFAAAGRRLGVTPYMLVLAAFQAVLSRQAGTADVVTGSPVAGRLRPEVEDLIGFFVNTLVLRGDLSGDPSFEELAGRVRGTVIDAQEHQTVPFEKLVEELAPERSLSRTPLFQVSLAYQTTPLAEGELPGVALSSFGVEGRAAKFDLELELRETAEGLRGRIEYATDLWDRATIERLASHFQNLLHGALAGPGERLSLLPMLSDAERRQALGEWALPREPAPVLEEGWLPALFARRAAEAPDAPAVTGGDRTLSYGELNREAGRLARRLAALGAGPEARIGLQVERTPELIVAVIGIWKAGAAYVPLDPAWPAERKAAVLSDAGVELLVTTRALASDLEVRAVLLDELGDADDGGPAPTGPVSGENVAYVIYTSGSTGRPKGVLVTHGNIAALIAGTRAGFGFVPEDTWALFHSAAFDVSVWETWGALGNGARLVIVPREGIRSPEVLADLLERERVTVLGQTPSAFYNLLAYAEASGREVGPDLRHIVFAGEALDPSRLAGWIGRRGDRPRLVNMYGITETTVHSTWRAIGAADARPGAGSPLGPPLPGERIYLLDRAGQPVPAGVIGEIHVGGMSLARGYLDRPDLTAERFGPDPFSGEAGARLYRSGDLARRLPDGELHYAGRADHQVKIRGFRIELGEIETALLAHPAVGQAVSVARRDAGDAPRLVAYVVPREGFEAPPVYELRAHLQARLPEAMVPAVFVPLAALPRTPNGKLDRAALPVPGSARPDMARPYVAPRTFTEEVLAAVWAQVLGVDRVGVDDGFFDLGGDSIRSLRVVSLARERGLDVSLEQIFRHQSVATLAAAIPPPGAASEAPRRTAPFEMIADADRAALPADVVDAYPLTLLQAGMLYHMEATPEYPLYHNVDSRAVRIPWDREALQAAFDRAVARHDALRTSYDLTTYSEPLQLVHRQASFCLTVEDLRHLPRDEQEPYLAAFVQAEKRRTFDLARPPLVRFSVHRLTDDWIQCTLTENHVVFDGWSLSSTLVDVFGEYLSGFAGGTPQEAPPPAVAFRDYVRLEREALASAEQRDFWRNLVTAAPPTELPPRFYPRDPEIKEWPQSKVITDLAPEVYAGLMRLAREAAVPVKSVCLAAHFWVLSRIAAHPAPLSGFITNGRPEAPGGSEVRGLFLNTVPLRLAVRDEGTWKELVQAAFAAEREILPYRRYPGVALQPWWGREPLLQVAFNFTHFYVWQNLREQGWAVESGEGFAIELEENHYPLMVNFNLEEALSRIRVFIEARTPAPETRRLLAFYERALAAMAADPDGRHAEVQPFAEDELQTLLYEWGETPALPAGALLPRLFADQAARTPERPAVVHRAGSLNYGQLDQLSAALARRLRREGVGPEVRVAVALERRPELVVALLGVLRAGGAYVPLDLSHPRERLRGLLEDSGAALLVAEESFLPVLSLDDASLATRPSPLGGGGLGQGGGQEGGGSESREPAVSLEEAAPLLASPLIQPPPPRGEGQAPGLARIRIVSLDGLDQDTDATPLPDPDPRQLAYLIYTSGSTGRPKAVAIQHSGVAALLAWAAEAYSAEELAGVLASTSVTFDISVFELFAPLTTGGTVILAENALELADLPDRTGVPVTLLDTVPSAAAELARAGALPSSILTVNLAGEPLPGALVRRVFEASDARRVWNLYGPSEDTTFSTVLAIERGAAGGEPSIGRPLPGTRARILDANLRPVPAGVPGELCLSGAGLARGYLDRPDATAERFVPDPFAAEPGGRMYRSGDLARHRASDGALEYLGRMDRQVKVRGFRIELGEIEAALLDLPAVAAVAVAAPQTGGPGEPERTLTAFVVPADGAVDSAALRAALRGRLPEALVPRRYVSLDALPLTPNGKVDRGALERLAADSGQAETAAPPASQLQGELEAAIAAVWREILGLPEDGAVGLHDNFFDLGGHSLLLLRVRGKLAAALGRPIGVVDLFRNPTVASLAAALHPAGVDSIGAPIVETRPAVRPASGRIAVVGLAGRFPGAPDVETFWRNLCAGVESVATATDAELEAAGIGPELSDNPAYVRAYARLDGIDLFDADFFGFVPRDAELTDPQHRLFLECSWEALESAGIVPESQRGAVAVFAGAGLSTYLRHLLSQPDVAEAAGSFKLMLANTSDHLPGMVSYKLGLRGPSLAVQTACSTSLVAVHLACRALLDGDCDVALAGGSSIAAPQVPGYLYQEGGILSPDGHCRTFDADARGTVGGSGVGVVVLKRLEDALADGDPVRAVILGTAINNDGADRVGYTAPGVDGQARVIGAALAAARVDPATVTYVEAHGTATALGDPIEVAALTQAFREAGVHAGDHHGAICALGSVKTNVGHLDAAAGVAGLIKTVLALERGLLPPSLHYRSPNPEIDFGASPFRVQTRLAPWEPAGPRRAGVSSFGLGGTNAHVVLEEPPRPAERRTAPRAWQVLTLSARTPAALGDAAERLRRHLESWGGDLADVAWTLQTGRRAFPHRLAVLCRGTAEALALLAPGAEDPERIFRGVAGAAGEGAPAEPMPEMPAEIPAGNGEGERQAPAAFARLWTAGGEVDWPALHSGQAPRRVPLPTYPFERRRYWIDPAPQAPAIPAVQHPAPSTDLADWFYVPSWRRLPLTSPAPATGQPRPTGAWLVFLDGTGLGDRLVSRLSSSGLEVVTVRPGERLECRGARDWILDPRRPEDYRALIEDALGGRPPSRVLHLWGLDPAPRGSGLLDRPLDRALERGLHSLTALLQAALDSSFAPGEEGFEITVLTRGAQSVTGDDLDAPEWATVLGFCRVAPREHPGLRCRAVDVDVSGTADPGAARKLDRLIRRLMAELLSPLAETAEPVVAFRGSERWVQRFEPVRLDEGGHSTLDAGGTWLITGGMGGIGLELAEHLARRSRSRLVLLSRSGPPAADDPRAERLRRLEELGSEVLALAVDVADPAALRQAARQAVELFGRVDGVIHAAGTAEGGLLALATPRSLEKDMAAKVRGALAVAEVCRELSPRFLLLTSSVAAYAGQLGQAAYCAANAFLGAFGTWLEAETGQRTVVVDWGRWRGVGMARTAEERHRQLTGADLPGGMPAERAVESFGRVLASGLPEVVVTEQRPEDWLGEPAAAAEPAASPEAVETAPRPRHQRPPLWTPFAEPGDEFEREIAEIWQDAFGIDRIGVHDSFFELGGDSLFGLRLVGRIGEAFGVDLRVRHLFEAPTVAGVAALVAEMLLSTATPEELDRAIDRLGPQELEARE